ncbi:uncharacterized protein Triagg1_8075 [Trichoderma aggressivum f. europaeum]|uniref:Uncharacterized protein n=1 Tax=Trichoderma aggressivum f. europaeum TaxID=173218 RepID=A0AAE1IAZ3_9HYPO|nr:hypothetical protein Triagg1_8075 [Trichoderma aggressivum f. europaeum]
MSIFSLILLGTVFANAVKPCFSRRSHVYVASYQWRLELQPTVLLGYQLTTQASRTGFQSRLRSCSVTKIIEKIQEKHPDIGANTSMVTKEGGKSPSSCLQGERKLNELTLEWLRVGAAEGAVLQSNAASLWPYKPVAFVLERLLAAGSFNLQTKTPVTGLNRVDLPAGNSSNHPDADKAASRGWTAHTSRGDISARHVLPATNAYTSHLLPRFADIIVPSTKDPLDIEHTFYFVSDLTDRRDDYLVQRPPPGAELIYGGGRIYAEGHGLGVWDDSAIDKPVARHLKHELGSLMDLSIREQGNAQGERGASPSTQDIEPTFEWSGIMGFSRDGWPWVVVDMMIPGHEDGDETAGQVDLPSEYLIADDRLEKARECETVAEADKRGAFMLDLDMV